jgi:hypothetical protein
MHKHRFILNKKRRSPRGERLVRFPGGNAYTFNAACAAARRAMGTRNGEQLT